MHITDYLNQYKQQAEEITAKYPDITNITYKIQKLPATEHEQLRQQWNELFPDRAKKRDTVSEYLYFSLHSHDTDIPKTDIVFLSVPVAIKTVVEIDELAIPVI